MKVVIGPVFDKFGGVAQHIFGIKNYSSHHIHILPSSLIRPIIRGNEQMIAKYEKLMNNIGINNCDIIHSHVDAWFTRRVSRLRNKSSKWVHTYHTLYFEEDYPEGLADWQKEINKTLIEVASHADKIISVSNWLHDYLLKTYSIESNVIPNGFDLRICEQAKASRFIKMYGINNFILFSGNIQPIKNPQFFIELAMRFPDYSFVMIGKGINKDNLLKKYGLSIPKNLYPIGELNRRLALDAIAACKVFVMTSKREGFPTALLEAMGIGKPVVVPNHSGCREAVQSNEYGFLYEPNSLEDLIEKVKLALVSESIGEKAKEMVARNYDWKVVVKKIDSAYEFKLYK